MVYRLASLALALGLLAGLAGPVGAGSASHPMVFAEAARGDVNCSGRVTVLDALLILQYDVGLAELADLACAEAADVNASGRIDPVDAQLILQYSAGRIGALP